MERRQYFESIDSTQRRALHLAKEGADAGTRVVAAEQTDGRGRSDHTWASPPGGLYLSLIERAPPGIDGLASLAIGAHLRASIAQRWRVSPVLKWPNDLLVLDAHARARKLAGTLIDLVPSPTLGDAIVVGLGVNVAATANKFPEELRDRVASLDESVGHPVALPEVEELAVATMQAALADLSDPAGHARVLAECRSSLYGMGRRATVDGTLTGTIQALGEDGEIWLRTPQGAIAIRSGDLVVEAGA
jgi:BirA family transcriptional regulator, biotin operon repressor / biotin---[acetyl-CoA-carboxylase] ligase